MPNSRCIEMTALVLHRRFYQSLRYQQVVAFEIFAVIKKVVMIWDTQSETLVGNSVYDVQNTPAISSTAKFETYSAQYVGSGL